MLPSQVGSILHCSHFNTTQLNWCAVDVRHHQVLMFVGGMVLSIWNTNVDIAAQ
ncbi:unnamed protein product [Angiostrongylus costaricensis]|uniref:Uncharacterized protein n=1 Tax=Angiostrongylus costaricensis TaxID=334426 RepID=A0A0R3PGR4_ANGCS|nr:unnamed protein product [Angiostrongylus costaricensis]